MLAVVVTPRRLVDFTAIINYWRLTRETSNLKMEASSFSETLVITYNFTSHYNPEDYKL